MLKESAGQEKAQMSALEQKVNSGQISDVSLQISEQMPSAFAALARKHQVPGAQFAIYDGSLTISAQCSTYVRMRAADNTFLYATNPGWEIGDVACLAEYYYL
jgi:hypothetical protein